MDKLFPNVKKLTVLNGTFNKPLKFLSVYSENALENVFIMFEFPFKFVSKKEDANLYFNYDENEKDEGYHIVINNDLIEIKYKAIESSVKE